MKDIVAYLRVSTEAQDFERQRVDIDNWCRINEWKLNNTFTDKLSGFVEEREGLSELKEYLITNNIKNVIVWELSRLGRDKFNLMTLFKWFVDNQINIFFYTQNFWLLDVNGNLSSNVSLQIMILSNYAETEALMIKERMKSGKNVQRKKVDGYMEQLQSDINFQTINVYILMKKMQNMYDKHFNSMQMVIHQLNN